MPRAKKTTDEDKTKKTIKKTGSATKSTSKRAADSKTASSAKTAFEAKKTSTKSSTAAKKTTSDKAAKPAAKKTTASKTTAKKASASKPVAKTEAKKTTAQKAPAISAAKKPTASKTTAKPVAKKTNSRSTTRKKATAAKSTAKPKTSRNTAKKQEPMPKGQPDATVKYSDEDLNMFKNVIIVARSEALEELNMLKERLDDLTNYDFAEESMIYSMHMAEQGSEAQEKEKTYAQIQRINDYLKKLDEALQRIKDKTYGICRVCNCLIAKERLLAVPITTLSASYKIHQKCPEDGIDRIEPVSI